MNGKLQSINSVRGIAALLVAISHWLAGSAPNSILVLGIWGVDLFFVMSGFYIAHVLLTERGNSAAFGKKYLLFMGRRCLRILPLYGLLILLLILFNHQAVNTHLKSLLTLTFNFHLLDLQNWPGIISHLWAISVEMHFYLFIPFIILLLKREFIPFALGLCIFLSLAFKALMFATDVHYMYLYTHTISCLDNLCIGSLCAYLLRYNTQRTLRTVNHPAFPTLAIAVLIGLRVIGSLSQKHNFADVALTHNSMSLLAVWAVVSGASSTGKIISILEKFQPLSLLGKVSYPFFLFHNVVPGVLLGLPLPHSILLRIGIYTLLTFLLAYILWIGIDKPLEKLKGKLYSLKANQP